MSHSQQTNILKIVLNDPQRKSLGRMFFEALYLAFKSGELPKYYFTRFL